MNADTSLIGLAFGILFAAGGFAISASLLRIVAKWSESLEITYSKALETTFYSGISSLILQGGVSWVISLSRTGLGERLLIQLAVIPIAFLIQSFMISSQLNLSFSKGMKISTLMSLAFVLIAAVIVTLFFLLGMRI